tara:strand:- start:20517 stop:22148 length:1632 start_codon:yes stop_codon:yes gene_type:complete
MLKEYNLILLGMLIIIFYYLVNISYFLYPSDLSLHLSLGIITDNSYLNLLLRERLPYFREGLNFFFVPFIIDRTFINVFGIENFWLLIITYKILGYLVLFKGLNKLFSFSGHNLIIFTLCLSAFFCIDIAPFNDKYPRPQSTNLFIFFIIVTSFNLINNIKQSNTLYTLYGISQAIVVFTAPWMSAVLSTLSIASLVKNKNKTNIIFAFSGFLVAFIPSMIMFINNLEDSFHSNYLGMKQIYENNYFLVDFYTSILISKQFILLLIFQAIIYLIVKRSQEFKLLFISLIITPFLFILIGKSVQAYHLIESFKQFQIILNIWAFFYLIYYLDKKFYFNSIKLIGASALSASLLIIYFTGNSWIERSKENEKIWSENNKYFSYLNTKSSKCTLITNDNDLYFYWLNFRGGKVLPQDGFTRTSSLNESLKEVKIALRLLSDVEKPQEREYLTFLKLATHNYFATTRSTMPEALSFKSKKQRESYMLARKGVNSMQPWSLAPNNSVFEFLKKFEEIEVTNEAMKNKIIIYKNSLKSQELKIKDDCIN